MLRLTNLSVPLDYTESTIRDALLKKLKLTPDQLLSFHISRRSVDARDKRDVHFVLSVDLSLKNETGALPILHSACRRWWSVPARQVFLPR